MATEPALAAVTVEVLRPGELATTGYLEADGFFELALFDDPPARIAGRQLANALAAALHVGPRPRVMLPDLVHCAREGLDLLLDGGLDAGDVLALGFGPELPRDAERALRALAGGPVLHWRVRMFFEPGRSRTCEIVDGGPHGLWRVVELSEELGGDLLLGAVDATEVWMRLSTLVPSESELPPDDHH